MPGVSNVVSRRRVSTLDYEENLPPTRRGLADTIIIVVSKNSDFSLTALLDTEGMTRRLHYMLPLHLVPPQLLGM